MRVLLIASEVVPFSKTGGLADVAGSLPRALAERGVRVTVVTPRYGSIDPVRHSLARRLKTLTVPLGDDRVEVGVYEGNLPGSHARIYLLDHPPSYCRPHPYGEDGRDYPDNARRFALLARGALEVAREMDAWPDIIHAFDWQAALAPLMVKRGHLGNVPPVGCVLTIHNVAFQGNFPEHTVDELRLGRDLFHPEGIEFYGGVSFLKAGILFADRTTTVSPKHAREIQTPEMGFGLDGVLRSLRTPVRGILNGVDYDVWDPRRDPSLPKRFGPEDLAGKAACKEALQKAFGLPARPGIPLIGAVSRLTEQKGFDLVAHSADQLSRLDAQLAILGTGAKDVETRLLEAAQRFPTRIAVRIAFDERVAHLVVAGSDMLLVPSRFEPCGLTQMYALRYGTIPIVRAIGGLDDTIVDYDPPTRTGTGFKFDTPGAASLVGAIRRATNAYSDREAWREMMLRDMRIDFSWEMAARRYMELYEEVAQAVRGPAI